MLQEQPIKCMKKQTTTCKVNNEEFKADIAKNEMYIKVRMLSSRGSENKDFLPKKILVHNFLLSSVLDPPSWTDFNRNDYIKFTEQ